MIFKGNRLNNSNLKAVLLLTLLIFSLICNQHQAKTQSLRGKKDLISVVVRSTANVGEVVPVRIKKIDIIDKAPKLYFNKNKIPLFLIDNSTYRGLIPLSADTRAGKHPMEIFYEGQVKRIDLEVKETKYPVEDLTLPKTVLALKATRTEKERLSKALRNVSSKKYWNGKFLSPSSGRMSTGYGVKRRINGVLSKDYFHKGSDFAAKEGSAVKACENGKVILAGLENKGFVVNGNCVFLDHGHGVITGYLHLSSVLVKEGDFVNKGQIIGKVGSTGIASGPHLHWGVYVLGKTTDPLIWTNTIIE